MCGVVGFVGRGGSDDLRRMTASLAHRGPDADGFYVDKECQLFLGHRRLSVIDIESGTQPMWNEDGTVAVVFNGEIYNHKELRKLLVNRGHLFRSNHSDTEVLVHGYEEWREGLLPRLNGMFAFAIYDRNHKRLLLARDRFGEKPLYYTDRCGAFAFASELKALSAHPQFERAVDGRALQKFFAHGFFPSPHTLYQSTFRLPGGTYLVYDIRSGRYRTQSYWRFRIEPDDQLTARGDDELAEELRELLSRSVRQRLESDVPVGVFLSGGLDSSAVFAMARRSVASNSVSTFTIGFDEPSFDESDYAREVSDAIGSRHYEQRLTLGGARELAESVLSRMDEPLGDASILPTYLLSKFTRQHVTVALSGDGGDELFAGYDTIRALEPARYYHMLVPALIHNNLKRFAQWWPRSARYMSFDFRLKRALTGLSYPQELWNPVWLGPVEPAELAAMFLEPMDVEDVFSEALALWRSSTSKDALDKTLEFYTNLYLPDDILTKVDRASMMVSLEVRAPFLDNDVVEFARRLPRHFKYCGGTRKRLLKKAMQGVLPARTLSRRKRGFGIPASEWLREFPLVPPLRPVPNVNGGWVARRWEDHRQGRSDHRLLLWSWYSMQCLPVGAWLS